MKKMDFTLATYIRLIKSFINADYEVQTFANFINGSKEFVVILRHDVDHLPKNSLKIARIESKFGTKGTYYFRINPCSYDKEIIQQIEDMGHEIGYHYENLDTMNGNLELGIRDFEKNLREFRKLYPVKTICMHGSPLSKYDNRDLWKKYDYRDYGIIGEPYFDLDFNEVFYLTDTGRRWDGEDVSVRDKVKTGGRKQETGEEKWPRYQTTMDIIKAVDDGTFPKKVMITFHPQRWNNKPLPWIKELLWQNTKNVVKKYFYVK